LRKLSNPLRKQWRQASPKLTLLRSPQKKEKRAPKVAPERLCPPFTRNNIFRKRSESENPHNFPGSEELKALHEANLKEMPEDEIRRIVGQLSWKLNSDNELRLWEKCTEV